MKKLLIMALVATFAGYIFAAETKEDLILKGTYAGLSYKKAVEYAELSLIPEFTPEKIDLSLSEKEIYKAEKRNAKNEKLYLKNTKKLSKFEEKIEKGTQKFSAFEEINPEKAAEKKAKIQAKTIGNNERFKAIEAYNNYVYHGTKSEEIPVNPKTGFPEILQKPFVVFDEGISFDMVTRLQKQDKYNRSDFVWQDYMIGGYFDVSTVNMKPCDSMIRVAAYYPFYHTFDGMQVYPKQTILYAFDLFAGPVFQKDMWKYVTINFAGGLHYMYQLTDEYHLNYLGLGVLAGLELPVARRWTIVNNGTVTLDYANLGTNKQVQPFDYSWSYQVSLGIRYSKKKLHKYAYIHRIEKKTEKSE